MRLIPFLLCLLFAACTSESKKPAVLADGTLPRETMAQMLTDLHIAEAAVKLKPMQPDSMRKRLEFFQEHIYKSNQTTKEQFRKSLAEYAKHPQLLDSIYEEVLTSISRMQADAHPGSTSRVRL